MNTIRNLCFAAVLLCFTAYITKPNDSDIIYLVSQKINKQVGSEAGQLLGGLASLITEPAVKRALVIRDYGIYKAVISRIDGRVVAYAYFETINFV